MSLLVERFLTCNKRSLTDMNIGYCGVDLWDQEENTQESNVRDESRQRIRPTLRNDRFVTYLP
jgi:hypothetical protein